MRITYDDLTEFAEVRLRCENTRKRSMCKYCPFYDRCDIDDNENLHTMTCDILSMTTAKGADMNIYDATEQAYKNGYVKGYADAKAEWISVENPPQEYRDDSGELIPFLVCCKNTVYPFRAVYDGTTWGDGIGKLKVTHWMPLPEPPKGE